MRISFSFCRFFRMIVSSPMFVLVLSKVLVTRRSADSAASRYVRISAKARCRYSSRASNK